MDETTGAEMRDAASEGAMLLCVVPAELSGALLDPLSRHFRQAGLEIEVHQERRSRERRGSAERRKHDVGPPGAEERRLIRNEAGRRVGERRALLVPVEAPIELPRKASRHADRIEFYERIPLTDEQAEDLDVARLVTRIQAGERDLFAEIYQIYFDRVYAYLRVLLRDPHECEDAAQQVFMQVFEALPRYERRRQPFRAWLFIAVRNYAIHHLRKHKRLEVTSPTDLEQLRENGEDETAGESLGALGWISDGDLMLFIERLPLAQRQVLALRFMLGMSTAEIATVLRRSENDVRVTQSRALRFLRKRLTAIGREPGHHGRIRSRQYVRQARVLRRRRFALLG